MDAETLREMFAPVGVVETRRMFGGHGVYFRGVMFALEAYGELWLKAGAESAPRFEAVGSSPFVYEKNGRRSVMSYWRAPEAALDDPDEMQSWARLAIEAAQRAALARITPRRRRPSDPR
jgi:DNA transformation protein